MSYEEYLVIALELQNLTKEREELIEVEDYDGAFEIECEQRDLGLTLADAVINHFNDYDTLVDENGKMFEFLKDNGTWSHKELTEDQLSDIARFGTLKDNYDDYSDGELLDVVFEAAGTDSFSVVLAKLKG